MRFWSLKLLCGGQFTHSVPHISTATKKSHTQSIYMVEGGGPVFILISPKPVIDQLFHPPPNAAAVIIALLSHRV